MKYFNEIINFIKQGGAISWILVALYFIVMVISLERIVYFINTRTNFLYIKDLLIKSIKEKKFSIFQNDTKIQKHKKSYLVDIINYYINHRHLSENIFNEAIERKAFVNICNMEKYIWMLSQIGHIAPLLGLLGTVVGLIEAFQIMAALGAEADVSSFASGIWVAMITTANGLIVAIPSFFIFRIFERVIEKRSNQITEIISILKEYCSNNTQTNAAKDVLYTHPHYHDTTKKEDIHESF